MYIAHIGYELIRKDSAILKCTLSTTDAHMYTMPKKQNA